MKIILTADINSDLVSIISKEKGYSSTLSVNDVKTASSHDIPNPETEEQFIWRVYSTAFSNDITNIVLSHEEKKLSAEKLAKEQAMKESILSGITMTIE